MTTAVEATATPTRAATLRTLAGLEARRYARHPLFLAGAALLGWVTVVDSDDLAVATGAGDSAMAPAVFLGLLGVFVGHQLARSLARSADAVEAAPVDGVTRTVALCLACAVPGAVALAWLAWMSVALRVWTAPDTAAVSSVELTAMLVAGVVYAVGGPLVGIMVGRWTPLPGAGLLAAVVLALWTLLATLGLMMPASRIANLVHLNAPFTSWVSSDGPAPEPPWVAGGSPLWYLAYTTLLCGLAATTAALHGTIGAQRSRLLRAWVILAGLALASLALAAAADPTRVLL